MTGDVAAPRRDRTGWFTSVRQRLERIGRPALGLILLLFVVEVVHGFRVIGTPWQAGDLLYHGALANEILRGEVPPGGPYAGLPTYYPPGFHLMLAAAMAAFGLDQIRADQVLTLLWLPVLPVGTFLLCRRLTGRLWVAVAAAVLTCFGGAYALGAGRLWVNSLFMVGQESYPVYPRDVVFAILPFGVLAFVRSSDVGSTSRRIGWAVLAGSLFGAAALVQIQLLLPLPPALAITAVVTGIRRPASRRAVLSAMLVTGVVATALAVPWLVDQVRAIARNGGVVLDSSDTLEAARFGFWSYPRQFGLILPLAIVGSGVALLFLHRQDGPRPGGGSGRWAPRPPEGALLLVVWAVVAFGLGVLYQPDWPLEDALRPQRMWLLASQPMAILAAIGLAAIADHALTRLGQRRRWVALTVAAVLVLITVPTTIATARLVASTWNRPTYAHLDLASDRVPAFGSLLGRDGAPSTVLTYEDWSALAWFEVGTKVVAIEPPGFAKLAYDPAKFAARSQSERRADLGRAFAGDDAAMTAIADEYDARTLVLARRAGAIGTVDQPATILAAAPGAVSGHWDVVEGNGWDAIALAPGSTLRTSMPSGAIRVEIRLLDKPGEPAPDIRATTVEPDGTRITVALERAPGERPDWEVVVGTLEMPERGSLEITAANSVTVQSLRGFVERDGPPAGWRISVETADAVVLERLGR